MGKNNNAIQILRGTRDAIVNTSETLLPGQLIYNMTDNYITAGKAAADGNPEDTSVDSAPITVRELHGWTGDANGIVDEASKGFEYGIKYEEGVGLKITGPNSKSTITLGDYIIIGGNVKAQDITTDTLFYSSLATDGLTIENGIVTAYNGNASSVYIPDFFNGVAVTRIDDSVFSGHTEIVEVRFPKRLEYISAEAFYGCTGLVSVELGDIDLDISPSIESGAFGGCTSLSSVTINAVYLGTIESGAFGIASGQVCALYRPTSVEDESAWETLASRENLRLSVKYSTKKAFESNRAKADGEGYNIAEHYAKKTGTYQSMTVGNATNAETTDFSSTEWKTGFSGSLTIPLTDKNVQVHVQTQQGGRLDFGVIQPYGLNQNQAFSPVSFYNTFWWQIRTEITDSGYVVRLYKGTLKGTIHAQTQGSEVPLTMTWEEEGGLQISYRAIR